MNVAAAPAWFWPAVLVIGAGTFLFRSAFVHGLAGRELPPGVARALRLVPAAALSALIVSTIATAAAAETSSLGPPRLWAALLALVVALRVRNMFLTIATGMVALWILQRILP
ncbi:AzlD domain-containing protein [bacterium]|nr:AzlD domain-containing protein [bacterium]